MTWNDIQKRLYGDFKPDDLWVTCHACAEKVHQGVGVLHIKEEHPEMTKSIEDAVRRSTGQL